MIREIEALAALKGLAGVQKLIGVCPETLTLITEYCGETWSDVLERRQSSVKECLEVVGQVCRTIAAIHARGWIHIDLKANNICVQRTSGGVQATVIDFGLAVQVGTRHRFRNGDIHMAPEVIKGLPCTTAADVYSIGQLLEEILEYYQIDSHFYLRFWISEAVQPLRYHRAHLKTLLEKVSLALAEATRAQVPPPAPSPAMTETPAPEPHSGQRCHTSMNGRS
nr:calcium/calmodulin-dependent protein kinase type II-like [Procambarus clarkii]